MITKETSTEEITNKLIEVNNELKSLTYTGNEKRYNYLTTEKNNLIDILDIRRGKELQNDLFDDIRKLPKEVQDILEVFVDNETEGKDGYENCAELVESLEKIGYTCEYYLDAVPYNLKKL